jgi:hypothetical protein
MIIAATLNEIGIIHGNQGRTLLALQYFEESLRIRQQCQCQVLNDADPDADPDEGNMNISTALFNIVPVSGVE